MHPQRACFELYSEMFGGITMKKLMIGGVAMSLLSLVTVALATLDNHPHLKAAHEKVETAVQDLQQANDGKKEYGGHREQAEQLLRDAQKEINEAAEYADSHPEEVKPPRTLGRR